MTGAPRHLEVFAVEDDDTVWLNTIHGPVQLGWYIGDETTSLHWSEHCNDLIARVCGLYPKNFVGVCQLPQ